MRHWWRRWSYEIPLAIGDALWEVLVVQFAAFLDRLTLRKVIAFIPIVVVGLAYYHQIPLPPELMLVGDLLAYIDVVSVLLLLGMLSRIATIIFIVKQAATGAARLASRLLARVQRLDLRHRRERGAATRARRKPAPSDDDRASGAVWAQFAVA